LNSDLFDDKSRDCGRDEQNAKNDCWIKQYFLKAPPCVVRSSRSAERRT